jgi:hypothetical protein
MKKCNCLKELIEQIGDNRLPFTEEKLTEKVKIRHFDPSYPAYLYRWHWDEEDRLIEALIPNDWKFQFDNELPLALDREIFIEKGRIHRIIKGSTPLSIKITS